MADSLRPRAHKGCGRAGVADETPRERGPSTSAASSKSIRRLVLGTVRPLGAPSEVNLVSCKLADAMPVMVRGHHGRGLPARGRQAIECWSHAVGFYAALRTHLSHVTLKNLGG